MIRWFADLPIERKLRVVILVPAIAVFAVAMTAHIAMNLLHLRDDLRWSAARIARVTGASTIEALRLADDKAALQAMNGLRGEWLVSAVEVLSPTGQKLATYNREQNDVHLVSAAEQSSDAISHAAPRIDPQRPPLYFQAGEIHSIAAVVRNQHLLGFSFWRA